MVFLIEIRRSKSGDLEDLIIPQPLVENAEFSTATLVNGLKVTVIKANEDLDQAYLSLTVHAGSQQDPKDFSGLTHLLEHLLFVGSENYRDPETLNEIVSEFGGDSNGETDDETTSFFFRLDGRGLKKLLPVMVDGIMHPLLTHRSIKKEINNVNSEIDMNMTFERSQGVYKLLKSVGNPQSSMFWDGFANIDSDKWDPVAVRKKLKKIHTQYYKPGNMSLVVISEKKPEVMIALIKEHFNVVLSSRSHKGQSDIDNLQNNINQLEIPVFMPPAQGRVFYLEAESAMSKLTIAFDVIVSNIVSEFSGIEFFDFLMTFKERGSFRDSILRSKLVAFVSSEMLFRNDDRGIFAVTFELTERGVDEVDKVLAAFYQFLRFFKGLDTKQINYDEIQNYSKFAFLFKEYEGTPFEQIEDDYFERVMNMSNNLVKFNYKSVLMGRKVWGDWNQNRFNLLMRCLELRRAVFVLEVADFRKREELQPAKWDDFRIEKSVVKSEEQIQADEKQTQIPDSGDSQNKQLTSEVDGKDGRNLRLDSGFKNPNSNNFINNEDTNPPNAKARSGLKLLQYPTELNPNLEAKINENMKKIVSVTKQISQKKINLQSAKTKAKHKRFLEIKENDSEDGQEIIEKLLKNPRQRVELEFKSDFDGGRAFSSETISPTEWEAVEDFFRKQDSFFPTKVTYETKKIMKFDMVSECTIPEAIRVENQDNSIYKKYMKTDGDNTEDIEEIDETAKPEPGNENLALMEEDENKVDVQRIIDVLFSPEIRGYKARRLEIVKSFLALKICMVKEFESDDEEPRPQRILSEHSMAVFFRQFRKPLTPRISLRFSVTLTEILDTLASDSAIAKQHLSLELQALAGYLDLYVDYYFGDYKLRGHSVSFSFDGVGLQINFSGPSSEFLRFISRVFFELTPLENEDDNRSGLMRLACKELEVEIRDQAKLSASDLAEFSLKRAFDQTAVNARDPEAADKYVDFIRTLSVNNVAKWVKLFRLDGILRVLILGNLRKDDALIIGDRVKHFFRNIEFERKSHSVREEHGTGEHSEETSDASQQDRVLDEDMMETPSSLSPISDIQKNGSNLESDNVSDRLGDRVKQILDKSTLNFNNQAQHFMIRESIDGTKAKNSVYLTFFHMSEPTLRHRILLEILTRWLDTAVFGELREKLNLGYVAQSWVQEFRRRPGVAIMIQGENFRASEVESAVEHTVRGEIINIIINIDD